MKSRMPANGILLALVAATGLVAGCATTGRPGPVEGHAAADTGADAARDSLPSLEGEPTLDDYLAYAALNNPGLRAAFSRWRAALEKVPQAKALPDPRLSHSQYLEAVETRVGPQRWNVSLAQTFPWFGTLGLRGRAAAHAADAARMHYEAARLKLVFTVKNAYYEYHYLSRAIAVTEKNVEFLKEFEDDVLARFKVGAAPHSAVIRARVELGKLEDRLESLRDLQSPIAARLNAALNRPPDAPVPWPKELPESNTSTTSAELLEWLAQNNPELKALDFAAARERAGVALAKKDRFPDLTLGVTYIETDEALMAGTPDSGKDPVIAMLSISLPIWARKYNAAEREAGARLASALEERQDKANTLAAELKMAWYNFRDAERKITLYNEKLIPDAQDGRDVTQTAFEADTAGFLDLIDAERTLLEFQLLYERALADRAQRLAELEMLVGTKIPRSGQEAQTGTD